MELQITEVIPQEKGRVRLTLANGVTMQLYKGEVRKLSLKEGDYLSEEQYQYLLKEVLGRRATKRAMHLLEQQDRTEQQLYDKLKQNGYPEECIQMAISYVKSYHYIDDYRFSLIYIRYHQQKKSRQKLMLELMARGVKRDVIEQAMEEEYFFDEKEKIHQLLQKRHYHAETADEGETRRTYQFLLRRGYRSNDILSVMKQCECLE